MKQTFIFAMLLTILTASSLITRANFNDDHIEKLFAAYFPGAQKVKWGTEGDYRKVSFIYNGKGAQALFDSKGKMIGFVRNVLYADLPIKVMLSISKRFENAAPYAMTEINREDGTLYKMFFDIGTKQVVAFVYPDGGFNKIKAIHPQP
jgi:hypothetical protein